MWRRIFLLYVLFMAEYRRENDSCLFRNYESFLKSLIEGQIILGNNYDVKFMDALILLKYNWNFVYKHICLLIDSNIIEIKIIVSNDECDFLEYQRRFIQFFFLSILTLAMVHSFWNQLSFYYTVIIIWTIDKTTVTLLSYWTIVFTGSIRQ
jgi:hypothetical protein